MAGDESAGMSVVEGAALAGGELSIVLKGVVQEFPAPEGAGCRARHRRAGSGAAGSWHLHAARAVGVWQVDVVVHDGWGASV
jgi:hypothetical protein